MIDRDLPSRIRARAANAGARVDEALAGRLAAYVELLARWNRTINLTSLDVDPPSDEALDRLVIEPVIAAAHVAADERVVVDIGSGGGSPALPMKLALPRLHFTLVESKARKAAFLREAVRHLELSGVVIENRRVEEIAPASSRADVITMRAVRVDDAIARVIREWLQPRGRVFLFGSATREERAEIFSELEEHVLVRERASVLRIARFVSL
jgi:16S rRNA (guanine527-N7)-methyltransferase